MEVVLAYDSQCGLCLVIQLVSFSEPNGLVCHQDVEVGEFHRREEYLKVSVLYFLWNSFSNNLSN